MIKTKFCLIINGEKIAEDGDKIKVFIANTGEVIIGTYEDSDYTALRLDRCSCCIDIDFDDIESIEKLCE